MSWLGGVLVQALKSLIPWISGLVANFVARLIKKFIDSKEAKAQEAIRKENNEKLQQDIINKNPRTERQKSEENSLNS